MKKTQRRRPASIRTRATNALLLALLSLVALPMAGCGGQEELSEADRAAIRETLEAYLPRLAEAYATGNVEVLRPWAAEKELAIVHKKVQDLMDQENRVIQPTLQGFEIEDITPWNYSNAFVTTLETWDIKVLASGTEVVTSEARAQRDRVKYQLKRREDGWIVLYRQIQQTLTD